MVRVIGLLNTMIEYKPYGANGKVCMSPFAGVMLRRPHLRPQSLFQKQPWLSVSGLSRGERPAGTVMSHWCHAGQPVLP